MILGASQLRTRLCGRSSLTAGVSTSMGGRPTGRRDRRRQSSFHKERYQRMTVAGRTMGTAATSDGNSLVMALMVKRSRGLRRGWGAALWKTMTCCLSRVFSATSAARERSVSRSVASTALVISRSIRKEYPAVCSRPGSLRHEHRQDPRHFQVRTEYLRRTRLHSTLKRSCPHVELRLKNAGAGVLGALAGRIPGLPAWCWRLQRRCGAI